MALTKITRINTKVNVVEGLETRPQMPPQTLKQKFDEDSVNLKADVNGIVDGVNAVIDELTSTNGAKNIGTAKIDGVVGGNVQDVMQGLIPKTDIVQALGSATDKLISQKAVTDAIGQKGGGDMLKAVYDTTNNGVVDDAAKLGNQPPAYYAKKSEVDAAVCASATPRGYGSNNANDIRDGWTVCNSGLSDGMRGWAYVLQTSFIATGESGKAQIAISFAYEPATVAMRFYGGGKWLAWQEAMPKSGGNFSGNIAAPQVFVDALSVGNNNLNTNRIGFPASGGSQVGSDAYGCAGSFSTNGFYVKGLDNTWKPVYASTFSQQSTRKSKKDIKKATEQDARKILDVVVYDFRYKDDDKNMQKGVMAEDVLAQGYDRLVTLDGDGNAFGVDYSRFVPDLIQLVQIQEKEISELKATNAAILKRLEILEGKVK